MSTETITQADIGTINANQLVPQNSAASQIAVMNSSMIPSKYTDDDFDSLAKIGDYLPYLKLCGSNSDEAKRGLIPIGNHALIRGKQLIDMGKTVQCWICAWRPLALLTSGEKPVAFYDPNSEGFKKIKELASQNTGNAMNGALCGPQFLLFIPGQGFTTYFMSSKTAKNEAPNFKALIDKCAVIGSKFIETKQYSWHGSTVVASSQQFPTPSVEEYTTTMTEFKNPSEQQVQLAEKPQGEQREM